MGKEMLVIDQEINIFEKEVDWILIVLIHLMDDIENPPGKRAVRVKV